ncbi:AAA family ATPase [Nocardiopsis alborubida]|uniref:ATP-dependent Clp protease ATP-binding subunit n=1 Tax=Nocardiopsis alborubida TaxID=146802 RepID=A0A7X6M899_9ACTN|nr:AAA family ATPase [Nocardiopsis alborubida]NKY96556.1 ATP-dependent Clp protease ATP-binding subunit [Nocardiopsis alborubida]
MGLSHFTQDNDDDANNSGPPTGGIGVGMGSPFSPGGQSDDAVKGLLVDYNEKFKNAEPTLFRDTLIEQTLATLISKNKPNVLLKGSAGVGKTKIVEDIARRIALGDSLIPDLLKDYTIYELPVTNLVAGSGIVGQLEEKVQAVVDFASSPKNRALLFIDEIHQITGGSSSHSDPTNRKISQILKPALARGQMSVIGATTSNESRAFDEDPAFARRFTQLIVDELTVEQTLAVLSTVRPGLMAHYRHQIGVSDDVLAETVKIAEATSKASAHRPDNAITLLDRSMADRVLEQKKLIAQAEAAGDRALAATLRSISQVPLTATRVLDVAKSLMTGNAQRPDFDAATLRTTLLNRLQGQDEVLERVADRIAREELGLFPTKTPLTCLFAGTSGSGKSETAKILAEQMTGQEPIVLNMTEYHTPYSTAKIIGAPPGYVGSDSNQELPFDTLESNPHRVVLLDEFEKADMAVQRLFLSAFDEGYIRNAHGKLLDFSKAVVIVTTNAAREALSGSSIGFISGPRVVSQQSLNTELAQHFEPELLGRFSLIVGFNQIDEVVFRQIMAANYESQVARIIDAKPRLAQALPAAMPDDELRTLAKTAYVDSQGARPAYKAVRSWIEDRIMAAQAAKTQTSAAIARTIDQRE